MSQLLEDIARPISDSEPSGEDIARLAASPENEEWIKMYGELRELTSRVATNCESIVAYTQSILTEKSKDLRIAGNLCMGLLHQKGFAGLADGIKAYHILLEQFWDTGLFPSRDAARASNVKTLDKRLGADISAKKGNDEYFVPASAEDSEVIEEIMQAADAIATILTEKVPARAVEMADLKRTISARQRELGPPKPKPETRPTPPPPQRTATPPTATAPVEPAPKAQEAVSTEITSEAGAIKAAIQAADFLFKKKHSDAASYRIRRAALWYSLPLFNPEPNNNGKRATQYLSPVGISDLGQLMQDEDWESLVTRCEAIFADNFEGGSGGCFCLDLQRFLSTALKELARKAGEEGETQWKNEYERVGKIILQETALLVELYPWISNLVYSDEVPFADAQTKNWIEKAVKPILGSGTAQSETPSAASSEADSKISEEFEQATDLLTRQKLNEALDLMQSSIDADATRRGRFLRRLNLANLCLDAGQSAMARPILEQLDGEIERFSLDEWEPGLCVKVWNYLRRCYQTLMSESEQTEDGGSYREKADILFEKICRIDIRAAVTNE